MLNLNKYTAEKIDTAIEKSIQYVLRPPTPQKPISAQLRSNGLKFGAYVGAEVRKLW
jgi:hypothetical protein